jgi:hypothetical protein
MLAIMMADDKVTKTRQDRFTLCLYDKTGHWHCEIDQKNRNAAGETVSTA